MARVAPIITSLNAGEFSPAMEGRIDFEKYPASLRRARNVFLWATGAISKRPGFRYLHDIADETKVGLLRRFIFSTSTAYMLEFGDNILRFNKQQAAISANNVTSVITNGAFGSNINDWDDISGSLGHIIHDSGNSRLRLGGSGEIVKLLDTMTSDDWSTGSGWSYDAGNDEYDAGAATANLTLALAFIDGLQYRVEVVFSAYTSGTFRVKLTGGGTLNSATVTPAVGTETFLMTATADHTTIELDGVSALTASITSVTVTLLDLDGSGNAEQDVTTSETGTEHVVCFKTAGAVGAKVKVQVGTATGGSQTLSPITLGLGYHCVAFTPSSSPYYLQFFNDNETGEAVYIDDVVILDNVPLQIVTPWAEADLSNLRFVQTADVVYVYHPSYWTRKIERRGDTTWSIVEVPWDDGAWLGINPDRKRSEDNLITNPHFEDGLVGWDSDLSHDDAHVEHDGTQNIMVLGKAAKTNNAIARATFETVADIEHCIHFQVIGGEKTEVSIGTSAGGTQISGAEYAPGWYSLAFTPTVTTIHLEAKYADGQNPDVAGGVGGFLCFHAQHQLLQVDGTSGEVTLTALGSFAPFAATDVGRYVRLEYPGKEPGWGVITAYTDTQTITVQTRRDFPYASVPTESWRLGAWSDTEGHPSVATFYEGRQIVAASSSYPQTLWFSQSADIENMRPDSFVSVISTTEDNDALIYSIASPEIEPIEWLIGKRELIFGTAGGQSVARSDGITITATDIDIKQHTETHSAGIDPIALGSQGVFVEGAQRSLYDVGFVIEQDSFVTADLNVLADHIFRRDTKVEDISYQARPHKLIWCRRADGRLITLKYDRPQNVVGFTQNILGGSFSDGEVVVESTDTIPGTDASSTQDNNSGERDEVWAIVKRTVNGSTVRTIEVQEFYWEGPIREDYDTHNLWLASLRDMQRDAFYVDSGVTVKGTDITMTGATVADPVVVTAASHGLSDGDEVIISNVVGMTELNFNKYLAATEGNSGTFKLAANSSAKTITDITQDNPAVVTSVAHGYSNGDKVAIFSVIGMTEVNGFVFTVASKTDDTFELSGINSSGYTAYGSAGSIYHATDGSAFTAYTSGGIIRATQTTIAVAHLEGESVVALIDGKVSGPHTVSSGVITPSESYGVAQCGLPYTFQIEPAQLPYGTQIGTGAGKKGRIPGSSLWLMDAGPFSYYGVDYDKEGRVRHAGETINFQRASHNTAHATPFFTGIWDVDFGGDWSPDPRMEFSGSDPVPFSLVAVGPIMSRSER